MNDTDLEEKEFPAEDIRPLIDPPSPSTLLSCETTEGGRCSASLVAIVVVVRCSKCNASPCPAVFVYIFRKFGGGAGKGRWSTKRDVVELTPLTTLLTRADLVGSWSDLAQFHPRIKFGTFGTMGGGRGVRSVEITIQCKHCTTGFRSWRCSLSGAQ